jgi:hypothetical protein
MTSPRVARTRKRSVKVLDASFLIGYENGETDAAAFLQDNADEEFIIPSTIYTEYLLGEANAAPEPDLPAVRAETDWTQVWPVTKETADLGVAAVADLPAGAPHLYGLV